MGYINNQPKLENAACIVSQQAALLFVLKDSRCTYFSVLILTFFGGLFNCLFKKNVLWQHQQNIVLLCGTIVSNTVVQLLFFVQKTIWKNFVTDKLYIKLTPKQLLWKVPYYWIKFKFNSAFWVQPVKRLTWQCRPEQRFLLEPPLLFFYLLAGKTGEIKVLFLQGPFPPLHLRADKLQRERWPSASGY